MRIIQAICAVVMCFVSGFAQAQSRYGDWTVEAADSDTAIAATRNDSGQWFGKVCWVSTQNCVWALSTADTCKEGDSYVGLINANSGAVEMKFLCSGKVKEGQLLVMQDYEKMNSISANDPALGIAMPMQNGTFKVLRYSLEGSHQATQAAESLVVRASKASTREQVL